MTRHFASRPRILAALMGLCGQLCAGCTNELWVAEAPDAAAAAGAGGGAGAAGSPEVTCPPGFPSAPEGCVFDSAAFAEVIRRFRLEGFVRVNSETFIQLLGPTKRRDVYVSDSLAELADGTPTTAAALYASIDPWDPAAVLPGTFPKGTVLIHHNPDDVQFEVMVKRHPGFSPNENDWWFARFFDDGTLGSTDPGPYGTCMDCHIMEDRATRTDLVWGVPREALTQ